MTISTQIPRLSGNTRDDLAALRNYLISLQGDLEYSMTHLDTENFTPVAKTKIATPKDVETLKQSIIKSATYIKSVEEKLTATLKNEYVAESDIGTYTQNAIADYTVNGKNFDQFFSMVETADQEVKKISGYVRCGILGDSAVGVEIGDTAGASPYTLRLVNTRLSFLDNGTEVAYISNNTLNITKAQISGALILGEYQLDLADGIAFLYMGNSSND